jgi:hypothetical protein
MKREKSKILKQPLESLLEECDANRTACYCFSDCFMTKNFALLMKSI